MMDWIAFATGVTIAGPARAFPGMRAVRRPHLTLSTILPT